MPSVIAIVPADLSRSRLGQPSRLGCVAAGRTVLAHALRRIASVASVREIVVVHPAGQDPLALLGPGDQPGKPVHAMAEPGDLADRWRESRVMARKWSPTAWRGGLGGATAYDELLPAGPMLEAMRRFDADTAVLAGADWLLLDPAWTERVLALRLEHGAAMQMAFTQAPPGLTGLALSRTLVEQLVENAGSTIGQLMAYNPVRPQADPIGRDVCVQVPAGVRGCGARFIYDHPRWCAMLDAMALELGAGFAEAGAEAAAAWASRWLAQPDTAEAMLPQQVTLELTARRSVRGLVTAQGHVALDRPDMTVDTAMRVVRELGASGAGDIALTLGGLGDAMLHAHWREVAAEAKLAGVWGVALRTDLLGDEGEVASLLESGVDVVSVGLGADTAATYAKVMGADYFKTAIENVQSLMNARNRRGQSVGGQGMAGVPWIVPRLVKTAETLADMEPFFDRWMHFAGHAVIEPATTGRGGDGAGLMPELSPVRMSPPRRVACRQLRGRMTILSDGRVALCDQDWLGDGAVGNVGEASLLELWRRLVEVRRAHERGEWDKLRMCAGCHEWHRP